MKFLIKSLLFQLQSNRSLQPSFVLPNLFRTLNRMHSLFGQSTRSFVLFATLSCLFFISLPLHVVINFDCSFNDCRSNFINFSTQTIVAFKKLIVLLKSTSSVQLLHFVINFDFLKTFFLQILLMLVCSNGNIQELFLY